MCGRAGAAAMKRPAPRPVPERQLHGPTAYVTFSCVHSSISSFWFCDGEDRLQIGSSQVS